MGWQLLSPSKGLRSGPEPHIPMHGARAKPGGDGDVPGWAGFSSGLEGFATSELDESLGTAIP